MELTGQEENQPSQDRFQFWDGLWTACDGRIICFRQGDVLWIPWPTPALAPGLHRRTDVVLPTDLQVDIKGVLDLIGIDAGIMGGLMGLMTALSGNMDVPGSVQTSHQKAPDGPTCHENMMSACPVYGNLDLDRPLSSRTHGWAAAAGMASPRRHSMAAIQISFDPARFTS